MSALLDDPRRTKSKRHNLKRIKSAVPLFTTDSLDSVRRIGSWKGNRIFEDFSVRTLMSGDGKVALRIAVEGCFSAWNVGVQEETPNNDDPFSNPWARTLPAGNGWLQLRGEAESAKWNFVNGHTIRPLEVPPNMTPVMSNDGKALMWFEFSPVFRTEHPGHDLWIGPAGQARHLKLDGPVMGACFTPDGIDAFVLIRQSDGSGLMFRIPVDSGATEQIAVDLDTPPYWPGSIGISATDSHVYFAAAGSRAPDEIKRQRPVAPRQTRIYRMPREGGPVELVAISGSEMSDPIVTADKINWVRSITIKSVVAMPMGGGAVRIVVPGGYIPEFTPEGDRIAFTVGQFRIADWAVCLDSHEVSVDADLNLVADPVAVVDGSHEDFTHVYSPCGRWIAYHTHRGAQNTIPFYDADTAHDAVFVRAAEDSDAPEYEVSEDGWEIFQPRWSPDGRTILYTSWDRHGIPGLYSVFLIDFDPESGAKTGHRKLKLAEGIVNPTWVCFTPDGGNLVIEDSYDLGKKALWIMALDGSRARKLHDYLGITYGGLDCSPDGGTIVFSGMDNKDIMQLYSVPYDGGTVTQLTQDDHNLLYPVISPDGRWIAATRHMTTQELWRAEIVA